MGEHPIIRQPKNLPGHVKQAIRTQRLEQSATGLANSLRYFSTGKQPSWWGRLGEIDFSVLLIVGGLDRKFVDLNERMVSLIKGAELVVVPDVGHAVHIEKVKTFLDHVEMFLNTLEEGK